MAAVDDNFRWTRIDLRDVFDDVQIAILQGYTIVGTYQVLCIALDYPENAICEREKTFALHFSTRALDV